MKKKTFNFIIYNVIVVTLILGLIELTFTYFLNNPQKISGKYLRQFQDYYTLVDRKIIQYENEFSRYDKELFYTLKPGVFQYKNREFENEFRVNSKGLRDDEESLSSPEIIVLGDSYAMGWGVDQDSTFSEILAKGSSKNVLNAGVSSYGTAREIALLEQLDISNTEALIIQYCSNDDLENKTFYFNNNHLKISSEEEYKKIKEAAAEINEYYFMKNMIYIGGSILLNKGYETYQVIERFDPSLLQSQEVQMSQVELFLNALTASESIKKIPKIIITNLDIAPNEHFSENLRAELSDNAYEELRKKIIILDVSEILKKEDYYILDQHIKASFHKKIGDLLVDLVLKKSLKESEEFKVETIQDFEGEKNSWTFDASKIIDGYYSMNTEDEWGPTYKFEISKNDLKTGYIAIESSYSILKESYEDGTLVISIDVEGETLFWFAGNTETSITSKSDSSWVTASNRVVLHDLENKLDGTAIVSVFYWNKGKSPVKLDNFSIGLRKEQPVVYSFNKFAF